MKNIEKYHETKCALDAYNQSKSKNMPFEVWLELEYKEPRMQTLLEAAETVVTIWKSKLPEGSLTNLWSGIVNLSEVIEREKAKPVLNCDKYRTAKDAFDGFNKMCEEKKCSTCPFSAERNECLNCSFNWLFAEAEKEVSK